MAIPSDRTRLLATHLLSILTAGGCLTAAACDQYQRFGENGDSYGPVDPLTFPPANLGVRGDRMKPGQGTFTQLRASVGGAEAAYFAYPVPPAMLAGATADPLRVKEKGGAPNPRLPTPVAYAFEQDCQKPAGYKYDKARDEVPLDQQGNVFSALPKATYTAGVEVSSTYVPVVSEASASAAGQPCQRLKSEEAIKKAKLNGKVSGNYQAWLIIDPAAAVYALGESAATEAPGDKLQKWGWFNGYLLAYLDGGPIPTDPHLIVPGTGAACPDPPPETGCDEVTRMRPQRLYYPRSMVSVTRMNPDGTMTTTMAAGRIGAGYDVLQFRRGEPGYSPICQVMTYDASMPVMPPAMPGPTDVGSLPKDATTIETMFNSMAQPLRPASPAYIYCLQVEQQP